MPRDYLKQVCNQIYSRFPEVKGKKPQVKAYAKSKQLLIFKGRALAADGKKIPRTIRVVVDENGNIGKITTSR